jgi:hypothetical protein
MHAKLRLRIYAKLRLGFPGLYVYEFRHNSRTLRTVKSQGMPFLSDLLSNSRLRNSYFSVNLKNMYQLHFSRKKVQLYFSVRKVQLVAVAHFFKLQLHFSEVTEK